MIKATSVLLISLLLASCTNLGSKEAQASDSMIVADNPITENIAEETHKPFMCYEPSGYDNEPI